MSETRRIKITAELTPASEGGFVVFCPELDITTEGETKEEAIAMLKDAAEGYLEVVGVRNVPRISDSTVREDLELVVNG
ncbi:hypothetical protein LCGC14_3060160 [marine sediment metagenome]|uniref:HicB-like antitoxin of toxin-antitoxin system domain-containing protein n=1 Tax=marine sediment metagenome TaxID=412755 RepID=A0A0F8Z9Z0_9ZZZZ|nr:type II toxin-antitoxin system HicB family antitoxin [Nitrospirota bacterium]